MIIAVDIDNILNNLTEKTLELYNCMSEKNLQMTDISTYDFKECLSSEDADAILKLFCNKYLWDSLTPLSDSEWGLQTLINAGHNVYLVTATMPENFAWKIDWLKKYFPFFSPDKVIRANDKSVIRCDAMIDDKLDNLIHNVCERVCMDYPWNRNERFDYVYDIHRCKTWADIVNTILKIERKMEEYEREDNLS